MPKAPDLFSEHLNFIEDAKDAAAMVDFAFQRAISYVGFDFEYGYSLPGVLMKRMKGKELYWHDPRSIVPLLMSLALVEFTAKAASVYRFVVDMRSKGVTDSLGKMFRLPVPFIAHYAGGGDLFCLWQVGITEPDTLWDTWVAEKCFHLGLHHTRYESDKPVDDEEAAIAREFAEEKITSHLSLPATCLRYGIDFAFPTMEKGRLQQSFLDHASDQAFTSEQVEYAAADAVAVAQLYCHQVQAAIQQACLQHLQTVEMPWTVTNARIRWNGVRVDPVGLPKLATACDRHIEKLQGQLSQVGLTNVNSHPQVEAFFRRYGLIDLFKDGSKFCFDDSHLEATEDRHPAIRMIRTLRKIRRLRSDKLFTSELVGADGRLHPEHRQLGAHSGRNSMRWPNIGGIGRALRPLVVPEPGWLIGEVDLSQIEVGIAAAVYGDDDLAAMFNGQDVYVAMAKRYYNEELSSEDINLSDGNFKKKFSKLRDMMKVLTLSIIYGVTEHGLSVLLDISHGQAAKELERFMGMFCTLAQALREAVAYGAIRGYAQLCSGLRRYRARYGRPSNWEANWMKNTPVQGSANVVFKVAGNRLDRRYQHYGAKLILPVHDAFVFECRRENLQVVAKITAEELRGAVQAYFPQLDPRADINIDHPQCWNKDGKSRSLELWMVDPERAFG